MKTEKIWTLFVWSAFFDGVALGALLDEEFFTFGNEFVGHFLRFVFLPTGTRV